MSLPAKNFHLRFLHLMIIYQVQPVTDAASQAALRKVVIAGSSGNGGLMKEMSPVHKEVHIDPAAQSHLDSVVIPSGD